MTVGKQISQGYYHNEINNAYHSTDPMDSFAEQINSYNPQYVIDAGCGQNIWKGKVQNLVGFDWTEFPNNDYTCDYIRFDEHTEPGTADFVFCLGSIHQGTTEPGLQSNNLPTEIFNNLQYVHKWLKPGGRAIMRVRSDVETLYKPRKTPPLRGHLFLWNIEHIREWGNQLGFKIVKPCELRMVRLEDLSDKDLAEFKTKFDDPRQQEIITNEQLRRERNEPVVVPSVLKCWYIWWWQKI